MLIVTLTVTGLPETALPVSGLTPLMVTLVVKVEPPVTALASTITFIDVLAPPARLVPEVAESETKLGAPEANAAVQFSGPSPVLLMRMGLEAVPVPTWMVRLPGLAVREGADDRTLRVTLTVCGLPVMVIPAFTAASEIEPLYFPAPRDADVTFTVKVVRPLVIVAEEGVTANQLCVTVGVMVTFPVQAPITPIVKV